MKRPLCTLRGSESDIGTEHYKKFWGFVRGETFIVYLARTGSTIIDLILQLNHFLGIFGETISGVNMA
jgi:hypothetical protein